MIAIGLVCLAAAGGVPRQPVLGRRSAPLLRMGGLAFKDLDRNGRLDPYEDWRLAATVRAADLVRRMSLEERAGVMVHGTLPGAGALASLGRGAAYDLAQARTLIADRHVNSFITRLSAAPSAFAAQNNAIQAIAEASRWGIPVTISSDPRHHFQEVLGASDAEGGFSQWPEPLGFGAVWDDRLTRRFADVVRQEYLAVGIRESLAPQADLATEPRWARANGTFGEDGNLVKRRVRDYVAGMQNGTTGLNSGSVIAVVKHWAGYGAAKDGWDSHNFYGRYATFPARALASHLYPFEGAFEANVAAVMPTYSILQNASVDGKPLEPVGAGFSRQMLNGLLRGRYGFKGVVLSDWAITNDLTEAGKNGVPPGTDPSPRDIGMPWGVEGLTKVQRFAKAIGAGVDQIGGTEDSASIVAAVRQGRISTARVDEAARRILVQKFELGLFEQPYVDAARAGRVVGGAAFVREGQAAQARAVVLLQNKPAARTGRPLLPLAPGRKVWLYGVSPKAAIRAGFAIVDDPMRADLAIVRAPAPYESEHPGYFFGRIQHEGRLSFEVKDPAYAAFLKASASVPTVFVTTLERPLILTNVASRATALLGDFGIADEPLLDVLTGRRLPEGHLPFELPSSAEAVRKQRSDLPHDSERPLFPFGFGLREPERKAHYDAGGQNEFSWIPENRRR